MSEGTKIAKAYVQILPSTEGMKSKLTSAMGGDAAAAGADAGEKLGNGLVGKLKGIIAAAGIGTIVKQALDAGGALQQSFGGLDTLYEEASQAAKEYAKQAVTAGISMNDYAEQAVSFGASLKQAFGGDTTKSVEAANTAILDMADNAAKMGTPLESIQNAYQGFAKQNYTMLDNLKLGYGGTKTEMERLLKDAQKLSGQKYDLNNLGDVYAAIHVIQEDLGLTGVAAKEASETFTGSFAAMKAAGENLMAAITSGNVDSIYDYIITLFDTTETFVFDNLAPMIGRIVARLPQLLGNLMSEVGSLLLEASQNLGMADGFVSNFFIDLFEVIAQSLPELIEGIFKFIAAVWEAILTFDYIGFIGDLMEGIMSGFQEAFSYYGDGDTSMLDMILQWFETTVPHMLKQGAILVLNIINGIIDNLPKVKEGTTRVLETLLTTITQHLPKIVSSGFNIITKLIVGVINNLPAVVQGVAEVIAEFLKTIGEHLPEIIEAGFEILTTLIVGLIKCIPDLIVSVLNIIKNIVDTFTAYDWKTIGKNIMEGIKNGILGAVRAVVEAARAAASEIYNSVKEFFQIGSPSKLMAKEIGRWIPAGIAVGIDANISDVTDAMQNIKNAALEGTTFEVSPINFESAGNNNYSGEGVTYNQTLNIQTVSSTPDEIARRIRIESKYGLMVGGALG